MATTRPPLPTILPPLLLGTATFNTQYVTDPEAMPYRSIVARAIDLGVTGFDTSPYYGPSETLLGNALHSLLQSGSVKRESLFLVTKAGRIGPTEFDYSPSWVRYSILRSLKRLHTGYLDLVYMHDVEFVSPAEVVEAVRALRRLRDEDGVVRYIGISGFPVDLLCELAELVLKETGEPLDAVLSYGNFTVQNRRLGKPFVTEEAEAKEKTNSPLARFKTAGVQVVLNASILGMGLLTTKGIPADAASSEQESSSSPLAKWHPSPPALRLACKQAAAIASSAGERLESVAIRWALAEWARVGAAAGLGVDVAIPTGEVRRVGPTVCGVTSVGELEETVTEWKGVLNSLQNTSTDLSGHDDDVYGAPRQEKILALVRDKIWPALGDWLDYAWDSPGEGYKNTRGEEDRGVVPDDGIVEEYEKAKGERKTADAGAR
ncbi:hypothetical protein VTJ04DRAFT_6948 [Mycothermus thermophilus]|uniref:uncharacterized protein n=1 Tax=Humicola insolens TaxID=85995 RepID=UPI0037447D3E